VGAHGATLLRDAETGAHLDRADSEELNRHVVDVAVDGPRVTLAVDRKLLGDPAELAISVGVFVEGDEGTAGGDRCPDDGVLTIVLLPSASASPLATEMFLDGNRATGYTRAGGPGPPWG
jgi:hypothetical protein